MGKNNKFIERQLMIATITKKVIPKIVHGYTLAMCRVLADKFDFTSEQLIEYIDLASKEFDCLYEEHVTMEDYDRMLFEEFGIVSTSEQEAKLNERQ